MYRRYRRGGTSCSIRSCPENLFLTRKGARAEPSMRRLGNRFLYPEVGPLLCGWRRPKEVAAAPFVIYSARIPGIISIRLCSPASGFTWEPMMQNPSAPTEGDAIRCCAFDSVGVPLAAVVPVVGRG